MKTLIILAIGVTLLFTTGCATHNAQGGAALGASLGAITGQIISSTTSGTLIGAAVGWAVGSVFGDTVDKYNQEQKMRAMEAELVRQKQENEQIKKQVRQQAAAYPEDQAPPGKWVVQKGQWSNGKWVPQHRVWQPINPEED